MPMAQQEQLQQDREVQQERNLRLDTERVETVVSEPAPINVPSDQNGTSFFIHHIQLDGVPKEFRLSVKCWGVHPTSLLWHQSYVWLVPFFLLKSRIRTLNLSKRRSP